MTDWKRLVSENARGVLGIATRILGSAHDAEDVTQDVFREAIELADSRQVHDWPGLLRRMAVLRSIDRLRQRRSMVDLEPDAPIDDDPSDKAVANELAERLRDAMAQLSGQQSVVFSLAYFESRSREDIARTLDIAPSAVSTALYKARQKLKSLLVEATQEIADD